MKQERVKLFGAPTGNRVMKAKRVTGESAQRILCTHVALEHCNVKGCENDVVATSHPDAMTRVRFCIAHVPSTGSTKRKFDYKAALGRHLSFTELTK